MSFDTFSSGHSPVHRLDARVKLIAVTGLVLVTGFARLPVTVLAGLTLGLILIGMARLDPGTVLRRLVMVNSFVLMLWLTLPLTYPGPGPMLGPVHLSGPGLMLALLITLKANAVFLYFIALPATSRVAELGNALRSLRLPDKLCLLLLFSQRYILVIEQEYQRLYRAARLRCFRPATSLHAYRTYGHLFGMTLVRSWNRAQRVRMAMVLRGFQGRFHTLTEPALQGRDRTALVLLLGAALVLLLIDRYPV